MKKRRGLVIVFVALVMSFATVLSASADEKDPYQAVIDKLNEEYSVNISSMTPEERIRFAVPQVRMQEMPLDEFEAHLREGIIENKRANEEAERKFAEMEKCEKEWVSHSEAGLEFADRESSYSEETGIARTNKMVTRSKSVPGAIVTIGAEITNSPGYWVFAAVNRTLITQDRASNFPFYADYSDLAFLDARRSYAVRMAGYTLSRKTGQVVDANASRYAEFWAGSGM